MSLTGGILAAAPHRAPHCSAGRRGKDADKVTALATEHGGVAAMGPMNVMTIGRMSVIADPQGASFSVMQFTELSPA